MADEREHDEVILNRNVLRQQTLGALLAIRDHAEQTMRYVQLLAFTIAAFVLVALLWMGRRVQGE